MSKRFLILFTGFILISLSSYAENNDSAFPSVYELMTTDAVEIWNCTEMNGYNVLVTAVKSKVAGTGAIYAANTWATSDFILAGFDRRWDFGPVLKNKLVSYTFIIKLDGTGVYYDFTVADKNGMTSPSMVLKCKQTK